MDNHKIEIQSYQAPKRYKCNLCDRIEKIEKRMVILRDNHVVGDLLLCNPCLDTLQTVLTGKEKIIEEWNFQGGV